MICSILVIFILTSCVCAGSFVVNVTQSWYHAEENHNISLEWMFPTSTDHSTNSLYVSCEMQTDEKCVLLSLYKGVEVPEFQDKRFAGRVQWDKDVLREGRLRLHISRLQTNDSGLYWCEVSSGNERNSKKCHLNVTAVKDRPEPETTSDTSLRAGIVFYCALGLAAALLGYSFIFCLRYNKRVYKMIHTASAVQVVIHPKPNATLPHKKQNRIKETNVGSAGDGSDGTT
ncbi:uncharacterized protein LOC119223074 isoform X2 [Pungitius pungitius]|uniref:uncharacterized protein LOC119223074 isoform X2 n=1 Tax=Pungitius pungitius TaxID=134920 RepID=UPI002E0E4FC2